MPSTSKKQHNFMAAIANNPLFAKKVGVSQSVGKDFSVADKGKFGRGGLTQQKINKQNTRHGMMDLPVANLSRFAGMKKGGIMKKRRFGNGGETNFDRDDSPEAQEVERSYSAAGVTGSKDYLKKTTAPKKAAVKKTDSRASGDPAGAFDYDEDSDGKGTPRLAATNAPTQQTGETKSEPPEDTRGVSGRASRKYKNMPTDERKKENADRLAEELALVALGGGAGRLGIETVRVGRAANAARKLGLEKGNAAATGEGAAWGGFSSSAATRGQNLRNRYRDSEKTIKKNPDGYKKGGAVMKEPKDAMMPRRPRGMTPPVAPQSPMGMGMKKGGMPMKDGKPAFLKKMMGGGMAKYAKGGGIESRGKTKGTIIRMASGGSVSSASRRADGIAQRGKTRI